MADLNDVMLALGRVQATVDGLVGDLADEKASRAVVHRRLDEQTATIGEMSTKIALASKVDDDLRRALTELSRIVKANHAAVAPSLRDWQQMKRVGIGLAGLLALGGLSVWSILWWMGDTAINAIRAWLRIP